MRNPIQIANELQTFKRQHGGGSIIDEAVEAIRKQHEELIEYESMKNSFAYVLRWVKRICGRRMSKIAFIHLNTKVGRFEYIYPTLVEIQKYDMMIREGEKYIPNSGRYGQYV